MVDGGLIYCADLVFDTLPPSSRASDNPIAIACFLLVTFFPEPLFPACAHASPSTFFTSFFPYFAIFTFFLFAVTI
jgi:hypothetical protein